MSRTVNGNPDVWFLDTGRGVLTRFSFDPTFDNNPVWSPDGSRLAFASNRKGVTTRPRRPTTGATNEEMLWANAQGKSPADWSPDGRFLLYRISDPKTG